MKNLLLLWFFTGILIVACEKENISDAFDFGKEKSFQLDEAYHSTDNSLAFLITDINDSRCPSDVTCIWKGKADVTIKMESPQPETIILSTFNNVKDTIGNFSFELIDLSPYPVSTETIKLKDHDEN